jgi:hypothetical protein
MRHRDRCSFVMNGLGFHFCGAIRISRFILFRLCTECLLRVRLWHPKGSLRGGKCLELPER